MLWLYGSPYWTPSMLNRPAAQAEGVDVLGRRLGDVLHGTGADLVRQHAAAQDWNRSGTSPAGRWSAGAALYASFSITVMLIVTFGFSAM